MSVPRHSAPVRASASARELLGPDGPFALEIENFATRPSQLDMAEAVEEAIADGQMLIAEAGTGTGKTFAYLVPALLYGGKVIVSTGTKTLQDQLFQRDLPLIRDALRLPVTIDTCEIIPERWANYIKWDPLTLVERHGEGLKRLKALYIDCGDIDQYNLVYGSRRMHKRLTEMKVAHVYQEFADDHTAVDYRMDVSLPILARALSG